MPPRTSRTRSATSPLPLALSLLAHAGVLAVLACLAPLGARPERESPPLTVRFVPHHSAPVEDFESPHAADRRALPPEQEFTPIQVDAGSEAELPEESCTFASELPAAARRGSIGVSAAGALRVPHPRAGAGEDHEGSSGPAAGLGALAPAAAPAAEVEESTPPIPLECRAPEYPAGAASVSECGRVRLEIRIGADGRVESVRVLRSSGFARLDEAAESGVRAWRFRPARRAGSPVAWRLEHTIVFRVDAGR